MPCYAATCAGWMRCIWRCARRVRRSAWWVLVSIGQTQLGSNNKASVQLIASFSGHMLAVIFPTVDYRALARAWPLHATVAWGLVLPTLFLHNFRAGVVTIGYDAGGTSNYSWYRVGGMTFQPAELAKISFILTLALHLSRVRAG